jgi:hypothetical protein
MDPRNVREAAGGKWGQVREVGMSKDGWWGRESDGRGVWWGE